MSEKGLSFRITANASGMAAGIAQAEKSLNRLEVSSSATSKELSQAARITASVRTPAEKYAIAVGRLDTFLGKGIITQEVYSRAVEKAAKEMKGAEDATGKATEAVQKFSSSVDSAGSQSSKLDELSGKLLYAAESAAKFGAGVLLFVKPLQLLSALKSPSALGSFALSGAKALSTTRGLITGLKIFGVGLGLAGGSAGVLSTAVLAITNPMVGLGLAALSVTRQFFASRDAAYETAKAVAALSAESAISGKTFQNLNIQKALDTGTARADMIAMGVAISALDVKHFDDLAFAMEKSEKAASRLETAEAGVTKTIGGAFVGLLEGLSSGFAGLTNGLADLTGGFNSLLTPVAAVFRPIGSLIGTLVSGVMQTVGVLASLAGSVLRVGGLVASVFLSPFIVGLSNTADAIKGGLGAAFEYISTKIASFNALLDTAYNYLSKIPVIGGAFASNEGGVAAAGSAAAEAGNAQGNGAGMAAAVEEANDLNNVISRQESALSSAIERSRQFGDAGFAAAVTYQTGLRDLEGDLERGILNETSFAQAAEKLRDAFDSQVASIEAKAAATRALAEEDAAAEAANTAAMTKQTDAFLEAAEAAHKFGAAGAAAAAEYEGGLTALNDKLADGRINQTAYGQEADKLREKFKGQVDQMKNLAAAQGKRAADVQKMQDRIGEGGAFQAEAGAALGKKSGEALRTSDVRSSEGIASFMALATGREDPAIAEYRKSNATLQSMLAELKALQAAPLEIAGGAGG